MRKSITLLYLKKCTSDIKYDCPCQGRIQGAGPLKLKNIWFFGVKSWFFTRNTPKIFAPPSARCNYFKCAPPPNLKSWIRPWDIYELIIYHIPWIHLHVASLCFHLVKVIVFNATFNINLVISRWSVLLVEETGVPGENHRPVTSHWQTLSLNVVSGTPRNERGSNSQL